MACTAVQVPAAEADFCAPDLNFGQVDKVYIRAVGQTDLTDWTAPAEWATLLDNATMADLTLIRTLHVIGDKPEPDQTEIEYSLGRKAYTTPDHTVNVRVDETGDTNYALLLWLEENVGQTLQIWYSAGKYLYGGPGGIPATLKLSDIIPESDEELNTFNGVIQWTGAHPARTVNPIT